MAGDLRKAFEFWKTARVIFEVLQKEGSIAPQLTEAFPVADMMFRIKLDLVIDLGDDRYEE